MSAPGPPTPRRPASSAVFVWLAFPLFFVTIFAGWGAVRAPSAYQYVTGTEVVATTSEGTACEVVTVVRGSGRGGTECPATWTADGRQVSGTLTTHYDEPGAGISREPGSYRAVAWGTTAATGYDRFDLWWGLLGPFALVACVAYLWWGFKGADGRLARKVTRDLRRGEPVPWGPFVLHGDGLQVGENRVPWHLVRVASERKVQLGNRTDRAVSLELSGTRTGDLHPPRLEEAGALARVVRELGSA